MLLPFYPSFAFLLLSSTITLSSDTQNQGQLSIGYHQHLSSCKQNSHSFPRNTSFSTLLAALFLQFQQTLLSPVQKVTQFQKLSSSMYLSPHVLLFYKLQQASSLFMQPTTFFVTRGFMQSCFPWRSSSYSNTMILQVV